MPNFPKGVRVAIDDMQNMGMTVIRDKSFTRGINACGRPGLSARGVRITQNAPPVKGGAEIRTGIRSDR
ncbi:hypothetical protein DXT96_23100 [Agrobacterium sp. ICMP 6402]|nr:hypothetical protein [Agrobacterium sp. ICMP 6402]